MTAAYERLVTLAERELELVRSGALDEIPALVEERRQIAASLPAQPPHAARPALERAAAIQAQISELLKESLAETAAELDRLVQGRAAVRSYAPAAAPRKRIDHAA